MSDRRDAFFEWVWRLNGLLLLGLAGAGLLAGLAVVISPAIPSSRDRPHEQVTNIAGADLAANDLRLGSFRAVAGTQLLYAPLASPSKYRGSGYSGGFGAAHNLLFFDTSTKKAHWLLPGNDKTILSYNFLLDPPSTRYGLEYIEAEKRDQKAIAILLELRETIEGADDGAHIQSIAIASPRGREVTTIADAPDGMLGYHQNTAESVFVFYALGGTLRVLELNPLDREVQSDEVLTAEP